MWLNRYPAQNFFGFGAGRGAGGGGQANSAPSGAAGNANPQGNSNQAGGNQNAGGAAGGNNSGAVNGNAAGNGNGVSELEANLNSLADLWKAPAAAAAAKTGANAPKSAFADFTDDALSKAFASARISATIKPEVLSGLFDGNVDKANTFASVLDQVFQAGLNMSAKNAIKLAEHGITQNFETFKANDLPEYLTQRQVSNGVLEANPLMANPAYKPIFDALVTGYTAQFPNASQKEISAHAAKHIQSLVAGLSPQKQTNTNGNGNGGLNTIGITSEFTDDFFK